MKVASNLAFFKPLLSVSFFFSVKVAYTQFQLSFYQSLLSVVLLIIYRIIFPLLLNHTDFFRLQKHYKTVVNHLCFFEIISIRRTFLIFCFLAYLIFFVFQFFLTTIGKKKSFLIVHLSPYSLLLFFLIWFCRIVDVTFNRMNCCLIYTNFNMH